MSFTLTRVGPNTFQAAVAADFTISASVDHGTVVLQSVTYCGTTKSTEPFTFTVQGGSNNVGIVFAASDADATVSITEVAGKDSQVLTERPGSVNEAVLTINEEPAS